MVPSFFISNHVIINGVHVADTVALTFVNPLDVRCHVTLSVDFGSASFPTSEFDVAAAALIEDDDESDAVIGGDEKEDGVIGRLRNTVTVMMKVMQGGDVGVKVMAVYEAAGQKVEYVARMRLDKM